jgi:hypothetical protein
MMKQACYIGTAGFKTLDIFAERNGMRKRATWLRGTSLLLSTVVLNAEMA